MTTYLRATFPLVAEHREHGIVGTLIAYPPPNVAADYWRKTEHLISDPRERTQLLMSGGIALAKVKALAVAEHARGHNIGGSLLKRC